MPPPRLSFARGRHRHLVPDNLPFGQFLALRIFRASADMVPESDPAVRKSASVYWAPAIHCLRREQRVRERAQASDQAFQTNRGARFLDRRGGSGSRRRG